MINRVTGKDEKGYRCVPGDLTLKFCKPAWAARFFPWKKVNWIKQH